MEDCALRMTSKFNRDFLSQTPYQLKFSRQCDHQLLFSCEVACTGVIGCWRRSTLYWWLPKHNGDFFIPRYISGKIFMEIWSVVIMWAGTSIAGAWQGLHSTDDFQIVMETSLSQCTSLLKFSWKYDQQFSSGRVRNCWCLAEVWAPRMISKILWWFSWPEIYLW